MRVIKRSGRVEDVKFNKVTNRISKLTNKLSENVDIDGFTDTTGTYFRSCDHVTDML